jgi:hypothetical protein
MFKRYSSILVGHEVFKDDLLNQHSVSVPLGGYNREKTPILKQLGNVSLKAIAVHNEVLHINMHLSKRHKLKYQ